MCHIIFDRIKMVSTFFNYRINDGCHAILNHCCSVLSGCINKKDELRAYVTQSDNPAALVRKKAHTCLYPDPDAAIYDWFVCTMATKSQFRGSSSLLKSRRWVLTTAAPSTRPKACWNDPRRAMAFKGSRWMAKIVLLTWPPLLSSYRPTEQLTTTMTKFTNAMTAGYTTVTCQTGRSHRKMKWTSLLASRYWRIEWHYCWPATTPGATRWSPSWPGSTASSDVSIIWTWRSCPSHTATLGTHGWQPLSLKSGSWRPL